MGIVNDPDIPSPSKRAYYIDLFERAVWTFVQGFCAFWIVTGDIDRETLIAALVAGALSVAKAVVAKGVGNPDTAATLPVDKGK